ncbi:hypothetical protein POPA111323_02645 [Polynucleobacter paneuropaeus]|jgi:hypothetical protein|uniref:Uncharacterized protein n=1 Tax=Polynucleobacter paneuropaeus TaxID=2527775 RepID=A0A2Z4JS31_9BURK|nr:hypothetical protein [Polynucleobacter paneuropaeus]AWW49675.1 hypothetical protein Pas1_04320 [Polynucleobacter paneuropaeus]
MITREKFDEIKSCYWRVASWAVWAESRGLPADNVGDLSIFDSDHVLDELNPIVVIVGLNISRNDIEKPFANFHSSNPRAKDFKLRYAFKDTPLWGGYMTDILKDLEEKSSGEVLKKLKENPQLERENVQSFLEEINSLGYHDPLIIALGDATYKIIKQNFKRLDIDYEVIKIKHFSDYSSQEVYRSDVLKVIEPAMKLPKEMISKFIYALEDYKDKSDRNRHIANKLGITRYLVKQCINTWAIDTYRASDE